MLTLIDYYLFNGRESEFQLIASQYTQPILVKRFLKQLWIKGNLYNKSYNFIFHLLHYKGYERRVDAELKRRCLNWCLRSHNQHKCVNTMSTQNIK